MGSLSPVAHLRQSVRTLEDVGAARRAAARLALMESDVPAATAELLTTELATNVYRHSTAGGFVLLRPLDGGLEIIAVDGGPGLTPRDRPDPPRWGDGLGAGLATVSRHASLIDVYSTSAGTTVLARLLPAGAEADPDVVWAGVGVPVEGEVECGDAWAVRRRHDGTIWALVVDGLGHGPHAAAAAQVAVAEFEQDGAADPADYVRRAHTAMHGTRGGVLSVCAIDPVAGRVTHVGVGNVSARIVTTAKSRGLVNQNGSLGTHLPLPTIRPVTYDWAPGDALVLTSDGIRSMADPTDYPGLLARHPAVIGATLYRDKERGNDDATVLVVKDERNRP